MKPYRHILFVLMLLSVLAFAFGRQLQPALANAPQGITLTPTDLPTNTPEPPTATPIISPSVTPTGIILPPPPRKTPPSSVVLPLTGELPIDAPPAGAALFIGLGAALTGLIAALLYAYGFRLRLQRRSGVFEFLFAGTLLGIIAFGLGWVVWRAAPRATLDTARRAAPLPPQPSPRIPAEAAASDNSRSNSLIFIPLLDNSHAAGQPASSETVQNWDDSPVTRLLIPSLDVDAAVQLAPFSGETWEIGDLGKAIALLDATSLPGLGSNTVLMGHITVRNEGAGPFRFLHKLQTGDTVIVYTEKNAYTYTVREQRIVGETDASVIAAAANPQLTLLTCANWNWAAYKYLERRAVTADLVKVEPLGMAGN